MAVNCPFIIPASQVTQGGTFCARVSSDANHVLVAAHKRDDFCGDPKEQNDDSKRGDESPTGGGKKGGDEGLCGR